MSDAPCSTIPVATRFTRATGDCLRDERLLELLLALLLDERLLPPELLFRDELFEVLLEPLLEPPLELLLDALFEERLLPLLLALVLPPRLLPLRLLLPEPLFDPLREVLLREELLLPVLLPLLRPLELLPEALPELLLLREPPPEVRAADLREPDLLDDERDEEREEPPVREPAPRLELLRDDFFVAMLDSETRWVDQLRDSKQESRTNVEAARAMCIAALSSGATRQSIARHCGRGHHRIRRHPRLDHPLMRRR